MNKLAAILIVGLMTMPVMAVPNPHVAGDFNGWDAGIDPMTETFSGSNIWTKSYSFDANSRHEFKVTDGTWGNSIPLSGNSWLYADPAGAITITYDGNTYADGWVCDVDRIGLDVDPGAWTAVGDWQGWDNANPATAMVAQGGGIYKLETTLAPGWWQWKAVYTGTWDAIGADKRSVNADTYWFETTATNNVAVMWVNAYAGTMKVETIPEPATLSLMLLGGLALLRRR